jgi:ribosomal protein S12 methylthiotransferase
VIEEVRHLVDRGVRECVVLAQDIGMFGHDRNEQDGLAHLLEDMATIPNLRWIRLLYLHPRHINDRLIDVLRAHPTICAYLDMPLQHVNDRILGLMHRKTTRQHIERSIEQLRSRIPDITLRTTFIVGFPTETDQEFDELVTFVKDYRFDMLGAFAYSAEQGTPAYALPQIPAHIKEARLAQLLHDQAVLAPKIQQRWVGKTLDVLIEQADKGLLIGRASHMAPEVDGAVVMKGPARLCHSFQKVQITGAHEGDLHGTLVGNL